MNQSGMTPALFLHWGPGANSAVERASFGDNLPIHWWDQPAFSGSAPSTFSSLVGAAREELEALTVKHSGPCPVIAHSFGCQIARELSALAPELISSLTFLAGSFDPEVACIHLGKHLSGSPDCPSEIRERLLNANSFWERIGAIAEHPQFQDVYWGPRSKSAQAAYQRAAEGTEPLNLDVFQSVMSSFLDGKLGREPRVSSFRGPVRIILGAHDPLMRTQDEFSIWKQIYPTAECLEVDAGHFIQFERDASEWLP